MVSAYSFVFIMLSGIALGLSLSLLLFMFALYLISFSRKIFHLRHGKICNWCEVKQK